ncbi:MAG: response regulator, partial [Pseudomonadota bacterium]|nr:response regulator [Pseudomonadota bacterium]
IWSMHFIGMLAYKTRMAIAYDPSMTALSMLIAIGLAYLVLEITQSPRLSALRWAGSAVLLGICICAMHYTGMAAMRMDATLRYIPSLFLLSVVIAIGASAAALWIVFHLERHDRRHRMAWRIAASLIMGLAVCGMHYTGMAAAAMTPFAQCRYDDRQNHEEMVLIVLGTAGLLIVSALFLSVQEMLKRQVAQRTQELAIKNLQLDALRRTAENASQMKSEFLANISHELRTPLNGIMGMAYLLRDTALDPMQQEYTDTIHHSAQNLLLLINDVLDLSKIEAGELILDRRPFDIKTSFAQTLKLLKPLADKKTIHLSYDIDTRIPDKVIGDAGRFAQIVTNLAGNAVKFTETGTVEARLSYDDKVSTLYCEVKDTGIGIPENKKNDIFEKFVQGDSAITRIYGGTGLGLAITKQLVIMLGGEIGFDSKENQGSRFWFTLPATTAEAVAPGRTRHAASMNEQRIRAKDARVLIADDHPVNQLFLGTLLKKFGFRQIDVAGNGQEAFEQWSHSSTRQKSGYDVIFMDCKMPVRDGYETTRLIRAHEGDAHIPIIAMTANALSGDRAACFQAGMDEYLSKPLQPEQMKEVLERWFIFADGAIALPVGSQEPGVPMDVERLRMVADSDQDQAALLALFFRMAEEFTASLEHARRRNESQRWRDAAHGLRGPAANLGMKVLENLCRTAEQADLSYNQRSDLLKQIRQQIDRIREYAVSNYPALSSKES